jgi:hypothetical protein
MPAGAAVTVSKKLTRAEPSGFHVNHLYVKDRRNHPAASNERLKSEHKPVGRATAFAPPRPEALRSEIMTNANQPFLLGPGIGQRAGKPCEGEITGRGAIKECRHNAGRVVLIVRGADIRSQRSDPRHFWRATLATQSSVPRLRPMA